MKQLDMFGNEIDIEKIEKNISGRKKFKTMQETFGEFKGFKCKECKHCILNHFNNKNFYKCDLWHLSHSEATDIKINNVACMKFQNKDK